MVYGTEAGHVIYSSLDGIASNPNASNETINTRTALFFNVADVGESIIHHECLGVPLLFFCVLRSAHSKRPDKCRRAAYDVGGWFPDQQFVGRAFLSRLATNTIGRIAWFLACHHAHFDTVVNLAHQNSTYRILAGRCRNGYRQSRGDWSILRLSLEPVSKYVGSDHGPWDHQRAPSIALGVMEHVNNNFLATDMVAHEYTDGMVGILTQIYS